MITENINMKKFPSIKYTIRNTNKLIKAKDKAYVGRVVKTFIDVFKAFFGISFNSEFVATPMKMK